MILGRVVGRVWATRRAAGLPASKLLLVRPHGMLEPAFPSQHLVVIDDVDAGVGDDVIVCFGAAARTSRGDQDLPVDPSVDPPADLAVDVAVLGVVDRAELDAEAMGRPGAAPGIRRPLGEELGSPGGRQ